MKNTPAQETTHPVRATPSRPNPAYHRARIVGFSPDAFREVIRGGRFDHDVLEARTLDATLERVTGRSFVLDRGHYGFATVVEGDFDPRRLCFGMVDCPRGESRTNGRAVGRNDLQLYAEGSELLYRSGVDTRWIGLQVDRDALDAAALERLGRPAAFPRERDTNLCVGTDAATRVRRCIDSVADDARTGAPPEMGERALLETLAETLAHRGDPAPRSSARRDLVRRAMDVLRAHIDEPYESERVCGALGVSERALQLAFRQCLGMSPSRWSLCLRLNAARHALLHAERGASVTAIAHRLGFHHLGRFAQDYRAHFGQSPSNTLRR